MSRSTQLKSTKGLLSSKQVFEALGKTFNRSPETMRKLSALTEPAGFAVAGGSLKFFYKREQLSALKALFKRNPPIGSGRPKGSTKVRKP